MDTIERIRRQMELRGWSEYRLAKESGLSQSTIANVFHRNTLPSIPTLESMCKAFGITLSQFFSEAEPADLAAAQDAFLRDWYALSPSQRMLIQNLMQELQK